MLGHAAPAFPTHSDESTARPTEQGPANALKATALGIGPLPIPPAGAAPPQAPAANAPGPRGSNIPTMLGVARPGIAPLHPEQPKPAAVPRAAMPMGTPSAQTAVWQGEAFPRAAPASATPERPARRWLWLPLVALAVLGLIAVGAAWWLWSSAPELRAEVVSDEQGSERLKLTCPSCPDGSQVTLNGQESVFQSQTAEVPLSRPLAIGENEVTLALRKPGQGSPSTVSLLVPIEFRVRSDLTPLQAAKPRIRVVVEAPPSSRAQVNGAELVIGPNGRAETFVDVAAELTGPSPTVARLDERIPYRVTTASGQRQGELTIQLPIVPLVIESPGATVITERPEFMLTGRTQRDGTVTVADRSIAVDSAGRFAQRMAVSSVGETTIQVRATAPDFAPRLVPLTVRRVESLQAEAERLRAGAVQTLTGVAGANRPKDGALVAFDGKVSDVRVDAQSSVLLVEATPPCPPSSCVFRAVHGLALNVEKGQRVRVVGSYLGQVEGLRQGELIPNIAADIVVPLARP